MNKQATKHLVVSFAVAWLCSCGVQTVVVAQQSRPKTFAVLIGIQDYNNYRPASYADADAQLLDRTLKQRGQYESIRTLLMTSGPNKSDVLPTREKMIERTSQFLRPARPQDRVIFFFSGHGYQDQNGQTYLMPMDFNAKEPATTGVNLVEIREILSKCRADNKLLILDACHSGAVPESANAAGAAKLTIKAVEVVFKGAPGIHTLASCQADEFSYSDDTYKQGLYTYWLSRGLEGAADRNGDFQISAFEINTFVSEPVQLVAKQRHKGKQTPGQIVDAKVAESPILELRLEDYTDALDRVAELLHEQLMLNPPTQVGVVQFARTDGNRTQLGELGVFGGFAADWVERSLSKRGRLSGDYSVVSRRVVERKIPVRQFEKIYDQEHRDALRRGIGKIGALVVGQFLPKDNPLRLELKCNVLDLDSGVILASASSVIHADANLLNELGVSWTSPHAEVATASDSLLTFSESINSKPPNGALHAATAPKHPLLTGDFPYRIEIRVPSRPEGKKILKFVREGSNRVFVGALPGEEFDISIYNPTAKNVAVRVYIDGLNVINKNREPLCDGTPFYFKSNTEKNLIQGWYEILSDRQETVTPFVFVSPKKALAAAKGFQQDIGQMTFVFYEARPMGWLQKLGTGEAGRRIVQAYESLELCVGRQLQSITVHYVHEDTLHGKPSVRAE